ncbi:MAG: AMP-binding protein [Balneolaceae bacterium]
MINKTVPTFDLPDPELNFLATENGLFDYKHLYGFANWFSSELKSHRIDEDKPLALLSENSEELAFVVGACFLLQIPFVSLSVKSTDRELREQIDSVNPSLYFTDENNLKRIGNSPSISVSKKQLGKTSTQLSDFSVGKPELPLGLFFTSGSTGSPKVVPVLRRQILFGAKASAENFKPEHNRYWLLCLPLNHIGGISIIIRSILYHSAVYLMDRFDPYQVHTFLTENKLFQIASLVPTMLTELLDDPLFQVHMEFKAILLGGGPISLELINQSIERGVPIVSSYGMTEACAQIAANPMLKPSGVYYPKKSVGRLFPPNKVDVRDPATGKSLPKKEVGLIWLKGPQVFDGYKDKSLNKSAFDKNGWFNTGDYGHVNRFNQLFIESRRTDRIVTGGENVDPMEVENALNSLSGIKESAVFGLPDPKWGEKVVALVVLEDEGLRLNEITSALKKVLQGYKIPKEIKFVESLPKSSLGKIKRNELNVLFKNSSSL